MTNTRGFNCISWSIRRPVTSSRARAAFGSSDGHALAAESEVESA